MVFPAKPQRLSRLWFQRWTGLRVGFGIRQNLDIFSAKTDIERQRIQHRRAKFLKSAAVDGIMLEVSDKYKNANISEVKVDKTDEALVTSKKWLRQEQLDYDFGIGDTKDLIDAMRKELELRLQLKQRIFEFNKDMAELYRTAGIPLTSLETANWFYEKDSYIIFNFVYQ